MQEGDLIAERFRLESRVGAGAMGVVFRARDTAHRDRWVALKTWRGDGSSPPSRFLREAAALADLREPAVVGHVAHGLSEQGEPFMAMDWIDGPTLAEHLAGPGISPVETLVLGRRLLSGLGALHARGIVHRDLKPSNIMLPEAQVAAAQILDLGVARFAQVSTDLTAQGSHVGTARYMAPEQIRDPRRVDGRADVFALGCVLFECLTGSPAFPGDDPVAVLAQILFGRSVDPSELRSELPEELDQLVARLLARRPELRPAVTAELFDSFAELLTPDSMQRLAPMTAVPRLRPSAAELFAPRLSETLCDPSGERLSSPRLLDRASRPIQGILARSPRHPLIGRERELAELSRWLQDTDPITLWGGAGVGKTRLAHELARQAAQRGTVADHAVVLCDLGEARDSRDVVRIIAQEVGIAVADQQSAEDFLGRMLGKLGPLLLVLDRTEHLAREIELLIQLWVRSAPALRMLVTSRVRLRSTREYELGPLPTRGRTPTAAMDGAQSSLPPAATPSQPSAAARFVLMLAGAASSELRRSASDPHVVDQAERVAAALEGNALAIELALGRLPMLGFSGILERLPAALGLLDQQGVLPRAATMRGAIEWSWNLLQEPERWAFMQCAVFHGSFTLRAAERVLVLPADSRPVLDILDSLREQSLLVSRVTETPADEMRLAMPAVLREFGQQQLERVAGSQRELARVLDRHAEYCTELAQSSGQHGDAATLQVETDDWIAAAEYVLSPAGFDLGRALSLLLGLERTLLAAGPASRLAVRLEQALSALADLSQPLSAALAGDAARALQLRARLRAPAGELSGAQDDLEAVLAEARRLHDRHLTGTALLDLGVVHHFRRQLELARDRYETALDVLSDVDDAIAEARCHGNLGAVFHDQARLEEAAHGYQQAIALLPQHGQERLLANFLGNLALVEHERGRVAEARSLYQKAAGLLEVLLDARLLGIVLGNFGTLLLAQGDYDQALLRLERAHALLEQSGDRRSEGLSLGRLGAALAMLGRIFEAEQRLAHAQRLLRKDTLARTALSVLGRFVDVIMAERALESGASSEAVAALDRAAETCQRARSEQYGGRPIYEQSDDLRLYLALLEPRIARVRASLSVATLEC
jgi:serine/threonine protein kinase/predicted ATPase/Tfp pilus assembly protein PilF